MKVKNSNSLKDESSLLKEEGNISRVNDDKTKNDKPKLRKVRNGSLYRRDKRRPAKGLNT